MDGKGAQEPGGWLSCFQPVPVQLMSLLPGLIAPSFRLEELDVLEEEDASPTQEDGKRPGLWLPVTIFLSLGVR